MHRTQYTIIVTTPVPPSEDWEVGQLLASCLEADLPPGSEVDVVEADPIDETL